MKVPGFDLNIENRPETYKTILKNEYGANTQTSKLRRKMSKAVNNGDVCVKRLSSIGNGRDNIFFTVEKEYFIVYTKKKCFYCENIESHNMKLVLINAYELNCISWIQRGTVNIDVSEVIVCF